MKYEIVFMVFGCLLLIGKGSSMKYTLINEMHVAASAQDVWAAYGSPGFPMLVAKLVPSVKIDIIQGNGGVGSVLDVVFPPGSVPLTLKEKIVVIDHHKRLKQVLQIEGGYLSMGVTFYMSIYEILKRGSDSCIIRSTITYRVPDVLAAKITPLINVDSLVGLGRVVSKYIIDHRK
ncbi:hypothetical protein MKX03_023447 [Papaver bracteatum]|nr:hypothetical protein MKX03_023447 [Papaver bracteatum]